MSTKLEFKDIDDNYRLGLSLFFRDGGSIGIKPSLSFSTVSLSMPIVFARGFSFVNYPMKIVAGIFALAGLLFYNWSEDPEPKELASKEDRYKEACQHWNSSYPEYSPKSSRLVLLAVYAWDSSIKLVGPQIEKLFKDMIKHLSTSQSISSKCTYIHEHIQANCDEAFNITQEIGSHIAMDSVSVSLTPSSISVLSTAPCLTDTRSYRASCMYYLDGNINVAIFDGKIVIGRKA